MDNLPVHMAESPMSTPQSSPRALVCPPAPMKPRFWDADGGRRAMLSGIETARDAISDMSSEQRAQALTLIPRHCVELVFQAYCTSVHHSPCGADAFQELATMVPDLDVQLFRQACQAFPGLSWEAWMEWVQVAGEDHAFRQQVGLALMQSLSEAIRKTLLFG